MSITIEKASIKDAKFIAESILSSSRAEKSIGIFDLIFETNDDKKITALLQKLISTKTKHYAHFSHFLIAYENSKTAGCLCGYEPRLATHEIFTHALEEIGLDETYRDRIKAYSECEPDMGRRSWILDFIHVNKGFTALSIIKEMVQKSLLTARLKGYRRAATLIEIGSADVELIYKKLGFSFENEMRSELYLEVFSRLGIMQYSIEL